MCILLGVKVKSCVINAPFPHLFTLYEPIYLDCDYFKMRIICFESFLVPFSLGCTFRFTEFEVCRVYLFGNICQICPTNLNEKANVQI